MGKGTDGMREKSVSFVIRCSVVWGSTTTDGERNGWDEENPFPSQSAVVLFGEARQRMEIFVLSGIILTFEWICGIILLNMSMCVHLPNENYRRDSTSIGSWSI